MERIERLDKQNLIVFQDDELYTFTSDAILLSRFAKAKKGDVVADFCSGSGIVGFNLYNLNSDKIANVTFFEMQKPLFDLSIKSIEKNLLQDKFSAKNIKIQDIPSSFYGAFSLIVCNPPYMRKNSGDTKESLSKKLARSEEALSLAELIEKIGKCLKYGGRVNMVHRAERLSEIIVEFNKANIELKKLQTVSAKGKAPYLVLVEGVKGGKPDVKILENLINE